MRAEVTEPDSRGGEAWGRSAADGTRPGCPRCKTGVPAPQSVTRVHWRRRGTLLTELFPSPESTTFLSENLTFKSLSDRGPPTRSDDGGAYELLDFTSPRLRPRTPEPSGLVALPHAQVDLGLKRGSVAPGL